MAKKSTSRSLSKKTRFEVFKRDGFMCQYCGDHPPRVTLEVDHIQPICDGGSNSQDNLVTACFPCNRGKGGVSLQSTPRSLKEKAAEIQEREAQIKGYYDVMQAAKIRLENDTDVVEEIFSNFFDWEFLPPRDRISVRRFIERLGVHDVSDAMERACIKRPYSKSGSFKYFCGICWSKIKAPSNG